MVHRDPETGQYVAGGGEQHWDDYEFQHVASEYRIPAADLPGAFPIVESDIRTTDLDDLLDRHERADLVAVIVHGLQANIPGTSSAESALGVRWELHAGVGDEMVTQTDSDFTGDEGESGVVNVRTWESDSPDVLYHAQWVAEGSFADSTNGLGGGPDQAVLDQDVNFPQEYGACPTFDDRDSITESFYLNDQGSADISDSLVQLQASYTLVFAVHDRD